MFGVHPEPSVYCWRFTVIRNAVVSMRSDATVSVYSRIVGCVELSSCWLSEQSISPNERVR